MELAGTISNIVSAVAREGDAALLRFTNELDHRSVPDAAALRLDNDAITAAAAPIEPSVCEALSQAAGRIRDFHERQLTESWQYEDDSGTLLGQRVSPLDRVGVYVPGGRASYPSSVLMNVIPAKVAGVSEIMMVVPAPHDEISPAVMAAACLAGVDQVVTIGGAQAIAALAYGTETVPRVDKIVGPGNRFVAEAKRQVFGRVGIDMVAGPSEILIIADGSVPPEWVTMDLFAQAEHDEYAQAVLISPDAAYLDAAAVASSRLPQLARRDIVTASLQNRGALIKVPDLAAAVTLVFSGAGAPRVGGDRSKALFKGITAAGAIFMGHVV